MDKRISDLVAEWNRAKAGSLEFVEALPAELLSFRPAPEVYSFALQYIHIAQANYLFASILFGIANPFDKSQGFEPENDESLLTDKGALSAFVAGSYDFVVTSLSTIAPEVLEEEIQFHKWTMSRASMLGKALEHHAHHRGQTVIYFRMNGIKPPAEHLF